MNTVQPSLPVLTKEAAEKTARSIFVGNIPYEATEEKLIELFGKVCACFLIVLGWSGSWFSFSL